MPTGTPRDEGEGVSEADEHSCTEEEEKEAPQSGGCGWGVAYPAVERLGLESQVDSSGGDERGGVLEDVVLLQGSLGVVLGPVLQEVAALGDLEEAGQEAVDGGHRHLEVEGGQDVLLHLEDFFSGVGVVGDVHTVPHLWWEHLLVLAGDEQGRHPDTLEAAAVDHGTLAVPDGDGGEGGGRGQSAWTSEEGEEDWIRLMMPPPGRWGA